MCPIVPKFLDRQVWADSVDPDQTAEGAVCSGSALFVIPTAWYGLIIIWQNCTVEILG